MRKEQAKIYFDRIPDGHDNPLKRPADRYTDRALRRMVEDANNKGDCIINVGGGYYRPQPNNEVDTKEFHEYMNTELSRARNINVKRVRMKEAFKKRKDCSMFI